MMILTYIIDIDKRLKLTKGQGHKAKVKVTCMCLCKILVSAINHERIDGS